MFGRRPRRGAPHPGDREATPCDVEHLRAFAASRPGCEAYLEPPTTFASVTVVLVAPSGEWTRRRIPDAATARGFARKHALPLYDVTVTGYPPRMRAWNAARRDAGHLSSAPGLGGRRPPAA